jgi:hypothetical protein
MTISLFLANGLRQRGKPEYVSCIRRKPNAETGHFDLKL